MTRKEQEKLGKEIVERLNKGESVDNLDISSFYNIKQFYYIKIEEIDSDNFDLIVLPEDNDGDSLLEVMFRIYKNSLKFFIYYFNQFYSGDSDLYHCFTKFKLTGNYWEGYNLDFWLIRDERFEWIREKLKIDDPEYNLAMYELYGFSEEYVRRNYKLNIRYLKNLFNFVKIKQIIKTY